MTLARCPDADAEVSDAEVSGTSVDTPSKETLLQVGFRASSAAAARRPPGASIRVSKASCESEASGDRRGLFEPRPPGDRGPHQ